MLTPALFYQFSGVTDTRGAIWTAAHETRDGGSVISPSLFYRMDRADVTHLHGLHSGGVYQESSWLDPQSEAEMKCRGLGGIAVRYRHDWSYQRPRLKIGLIDWWICVSYRYSLQSVTQQEAAPNFLSSGERWCYARSNN